MLSRLICYFSIYNNNSLHKYVQSNDEQTKCEVNCIKQHKTENAQYETTVNQDMYDIFCQCKKRFGTNFSKIWDLF